MTDPSCVIHQLAVIVPAYKQAYLGAALASLRAQTDQRFRLYVCDDASPGKLYGCYREVYPQDLNTSYVRFDSNLGGTSLVKQWERCVRLTVEPWVWLFSDDDVASSQCVETFYSTLAQKKFASNVFRFNTAIIDIEGKITEINPPHPSLESAQHFAYHRLRLQRRSYAPEYIFRRSAYDSNGGFVEFPFALGSDDASWITFADDLPITTILGAMVFWRWSGTNTSYLGGETGRAKVLALAEFSQWMQKRFRRESPVLDGTSMPSQIIMSKLARDWFFQTTRVLPHDFGYISATQVARELHQMGFAGFTEATLRLLLAVFRGQRKSFATRLRRLFSF